MEIRGIWPEEAEEIRNASIVDGEVDSSGNLQLVTAGGVNKNAGKVVVPLAAYPVGSIFMHTTSTNPAALLGGGEWDRFGKGRVLVGVDENDPTFNNPLTTGGEKEVKLTSPGQNAPHVHGVNDPGHTHGFGAIDPSFGGLVGEANFAQPANVDKNVTGITIQSSGGGEGHNNIQPFVTVYMWVRSA